MNRLVVMLGALVALPLFGQVVPGRYIVEFDRQPSAAYAVQSGHRARTGDPMFEARTREIRTQHQQARAMVEGRGGRVLGETHAVANAMFVSIPDGQAADLSSLPGVRHVHQVRVYHRLLDHALPLHHVFSAWNAVGGMQNAGAGIKIGIIDTGIDVNHPAFQDASLTVPDGFPKVNLDSDTAYTNNKIIVARSYLEGGDSPAADIDGHGTGVAMVAAGESASGPYGAITGVAPKAFLGNYKVFPDNDSSGGAPDDLIIQAIEDSVTDGMDVINMSLGSTFASRPADDPIVEAVEAASAAGVVVVIAAGNSGPNPFTIASPGMAPSAITAGSMSNDRVFGVGVQVGDGPPVLAIAGSGPNSSTPVSGPLKDVADSDPSGLACDALPAESLKGSVALVFRGTCTFETKLTNAQQAGAVAVIVYTQASSPDPIPMSVGAASIPASMVSYSSGIAFKKLAASGAAATLSFSIGPVSIDPQRISGFSARGPNTDSGIKPDLVSVGDPIYTAQPTNMGSGGYVVESGTSFSSPMIAGAAAVLKAARPGLTPAQYKSLLVNSADSINGAETPGVLQDGTGGLNLLNAIGTEVTTSPSSVSFGFGSGTVNQTAPLTITNNGTAADTFSFTVVPFGSAAEPSLSQTTLQLGPGESQSISLGYSADGLNPGNHQGYVQIQGTQTGVIASVPYWYGVGTGEAAYVNVIDAPTSGKKNSQQSILVRVTDRIGASITDAPAVTVTTGTGKVTRVHSVDADLPGAFEALVNLGVGTNVFHIQSGDISTDVTITGK